MSARPWKLVAPLIVVGLVLIAVVLGALGLLVWAVGEPRPAAPGTVDLALSTPPIPTGAPPSPSVATPAVTTQSVLAPVAASPPVADLAPVAASPPVADLAPVAANPPVADLAPAAANPPVADLALRADAVPVAGTVASTPKRQTTPSASAAPAPPTGKIQFSIKPWGEIMVDGKSRGVSPPIKELSIPEGRHRIKIRNGAFPGYESEIDIKAGSTGSISYTFKAP